LNTFNEVMFFISVLPSEIRRLKFQVSWLCNDRTAAETFVVNGSRQRAMSAPPTRCRRTTDFEDWRYIDCLPRVGWRFADGDGYRSKEPTNLPNASSPIFSEQRLSVWKRRIHLLYELR
jgi:hypothetical protein